MTEEKANEKKKKKTATKDTRHTGFGCAWHLPPRLVRHRIEDGMMEKYIERESGSRRERRHRRHNVLRR